MTLYETIQAIEKIAAAQPDVRSIVRNDIYRLNAIADVQYGIFAWTQGEHSFNVDGSLHYFSFTFFFADRLTNGKTNEVEVQSEGVAVLENVLKALAYAGLIADSSAVITPFNERFSDECAGVFARVTLEVPVDDMCASEWKYITIGPGSFDLSFDESFQVWKWVSDNKTVYIIS